MPPRALITGISGFTGKYLASTLKKAGYEVFGGSLQVEANAENIPAALCARDSMRNLGNTARPDGGVHLGGISNVEYDNITELYSTNILGSRNLLQALSELDKPLKAVMLASSANVYGNAKSHPITETSELMPANDYSVSKLAMENMALLWKNELPIFIVRPFNYTGYGQPPTFVIPKIVDHYARRAKSMSLGNLDVYREFNDVRLIADIYRRLIEVAPVGKTINICSGAVHSLGEVIGSMNKIAGYEIEVKTDPRCIRKNEVTTLQGSNNMLQSLIGTAPSIPLDRTLRWMFEKKRNSCG